jgi:hypothetical protein
MMPVRSTLKTQNNISIDEMEKSDPAKRTKRAIAYSFKS